MRARFPGYRPLTEQDFADLWATCFFVPDANILLNLYRYSPETSQELLRILSAPILQVRVWIPHQVAGEFLRGRLEVVLEQRQHYETVKPQLTELLDRFESKKAHPFIETEHMKVLQELVEKIMADLDGRRDRLIASPNEDPILQRVFDVFDGRVGDAYTDERMKEVFKQGAERYKNDLPPGFEDKKKPAEHRKYGDLILWFQLLDEVEKRKKPAIFVTADEKADWWVLAEGNRKQRLGPRPELLQEMYQRTAQPFYIYSPDRFMQEVSKVLGARVSPQAIEEARAVDEARISEGALTTILQDWGDFPPGTVYLTEPVQPSDPVYREHRRRLQAKTIHRLRSDLTQFESDFERARSESPANEGEAKVLLLEYGRRFMQLATDALKAGLAESRTVLQQGKQMSELGKATILDNPASHAAFWESGRAFIKDLKLLVKWMVGG